MTDDNGVVEFSSGVRSRGGESVVGDPGVSAVSRVKPEGVHDALHRPRRSDRMLDQRRLSGLTV